MRWPGRPASLRVEPLNTFAMQIDALQDNYERGGFLNWFFVLCVVVGVVDSYGVLPMRK